MKFLIHYLYALLSAVYLFTLGIFKAADRRLIYRIASHFGFHHKLLPKLPLIRMDELISSTIKVQLTEGAGGDGNITLEELYVICSLVSQQQPEAIFEFGTFDGRSTLNMALNAPDPCKVFTLDLNPSDTNTQFDLSPHEKSYTGLAKGRRFERHPIADKITQLQGDSAIFDFTSYCNSMDLVFIDASHAYEYVKHDTETAFRLLRNGKGIILWHDCGVWEGVTAFLNECYVSDPRLRELKLVEGSSLAVLKVT